MYRSGNGSKVEAGSLDRKRINDALDKHLEKSSPSASRGLIGKDKDRLPLASSASGKQLEHRSVPKNKGSDGKVSSSRGLFLKKLIWNLILGHLARINERSI